MNPEINIRAYNKAKNDNLNLCRRLEGSRKLGILKCWEDIEKKFGITIESSWKCFEFREKFMEWLGFYRDGFDARYKAQLAQLAPVIKVVREVLPDVPTGPLNEILGVKLGKVTLKEFQHTTAVKVIQSMFLEKKTRAIYNDGKTGDGKTYLACAVIKYCIEKGLFDHVASPNPIMVITPNKVVEKWRRILEDEFEIPLTKVLVTSYSQLTASFGKLFTYEQEEEVGYGQTENVVHCKPFASPCFVVVDEGHWVKHRGSGRAKIIRAFIRLGKCHFLWLSATPGITVNNMECFYLSTGAKFMGMTLTEKNWSSFAGSICREPHKPNAAAMKRLRTYLEPYIISFPPHKRKHKAINRVMLCEFPNEASRLHYLNTEIRYIEGLRKVGKDAPNGRLLRLVLLNQYCKGAEWAKVDIFARLVYEAWRDGFAPVCGLQYQQTLQQVCIILVEQYKVPRNLISLIWGGRKEIKESDLLTQAQIADILRRTVNGEDVSSKELRMLRLTIEHSEDRLMRSESKEAQEERLTKYRELELYQQSADRKQLDIDNFQDGTTQICLFTLPSGGTGLDLDHNHDNSRPRKGFFTLAYWAEMVWQAIGRTNREFTRSDTEQFIVCLADTIEAYHMAPTLDRKLACLKELNLNECFMDSLEDAILNQYEELKKKQVQLRTKEEAAEDDDSIDTTQLDDGEEDENNQGE